MKTHKRPCALSLPDSPCTNISEEYLPGPVLYLCIILLLLCDCWSQEQTWASSEQYLYLFVLTQARRAMCIM